MKGYLARALRRRVECCSRKKQKRERHRISHEKSAKSSKRRHENRFLNYFSYNFNFFHQTRGNITPNTASSKHLLIDLWNVA